MTNHQLFNLIYFNLISFKWLKATIFYLLTILQISDVGRVHLSGVTHRNLSAIFLSNSPPKPVQRWAHKPNYSSKKTSPGFLSLELMIKSYFFLPCSWTKPSSSIALVPSQEKKPAFSKKECN